MKNQLLINLLRKPMRSLASQAASTNKLFNQKNTDQAFLHRLLTLFGLLQKIIFDKFEKYLQQQIISRQGFLPAYKPQLTQQEEKQLLSLLQRKLNYLKFLLKVLFTHRICQLFFISLSNWG